MDIQTLILYFYLLLPVLTPVQDWLRSMLEWEPFARPDVVRIQDDVRGYAAVMRANDSEASDAGIPLPSSLDGVPYDLSGEFFQDDFPESDDVGGMPRMEEGESYSVPETQFRDSMSRLVLFERGEEQLSVSSISRDRSRVVSVNADTVSCTYYDSLWRPQKKIVMRNARSLSGSEVLSRTVYDYGSDDSVSGKPVSVLEEFFPQKKLTETFYDGRGYPLKVMEYRTDTASEGQDEVSGRALVRTTERSYDGEGRLLSEDEVSYSERPDPVRKGRTIPVRLSRRNEYTYTEFSSVPDLRFYENGMLRLTDEYLSSDSYIETLYFDNDYRVRVKYERGRKVSEIVYSGDDEISRREFE